MNRKRMMILGASALLLSFFVTYLVYRNVQRRLLPPEPSVQIVVAAQKIPLGVRLAESSVTLASWPKSMAIQGTFADPKEVLGRGVIVGMLPNEPILESKLAPREAGAGLTSVIPDGMRAVAVKVDDVVGVAGFVLPGTRVDVILTASPKANEEIVAKAILENVQVLAAGQNVEQDVNGKPQRVPVVTLLVSPEQAQELALAEVNGRIQLALRNPMDAELKNASAVERASLFTKGGTGSPATLEQTAATKSKLQTKPKVQARSKVQPKPVPAPTAITLPPPAPVPDRTKAIELFMGRSREVVTFTEKK